MILTSVVIGEVSSRLAADQIRVDPRSSAA